MAGSREEEIKTSGGLGRKLRRGLGCQRTYRTTHSGGVFTGETRWSGEWSVRARLGVGVQSGTGRDDGYGPAGRSKLGEAGHGPVGRTGLGVRDSEAELGGADMSRRGKVR